MFILETRYGDKGYAFWFKILELLGSTNGHAYYFNIEENCEYLQAYTRTDKEKTIEILDLLANLDAIDKELWSNNHIIWSDNFIDGLQAAYRNRTVDVPDKPISDVRNPDSIGISDVRNPRSKVKESKVKESKVEGASSINQILYCLNKLKSWRPTDDDEQWLSDFQEEFPDFTLTELKKCLDYYSGRATPKHKGIWKNRFRNWMEKKKEFDDGKGGRHSKGHSAEELEASIGKPLG